MRIAITALSVYPFGIGGAEIYAYQVAKHLAKLHDIIIISSSDRRRGYHRDRRSNLLYYLVKVPKIPLIYHLFYFVRTFPVLVKFKPDAVYVNTVVSTGFIAPFLHFTCKVPYIIVIHGYELDVIGKSRLYGFLLKVELLFSRYVVAVARKVVKSLTANFKVPVSKIRIIPVGYDEREADMLRTNTHADLSKIVKRIIYVGRLSPEKDILNLLKAVSILCLTYLIIFRFKVFFC